MRKKPRIFSQTHRLFNVLCLAVILAVVQTPRLFGDSLWEWLFGGDHSSSSVPYSGTGGGGHVGQGLQGLNSPSYVPEIDPTVAVSAIVVLVCGLVILNSGKKTRLRTG